MRFLNRLLHISDPGTRTRARARAARARRVFACAATSKHICMIFDACCVFELTLESHGLSARVGCGGLCLAFAMESRPDLGTGGDGGVPDGAISEAGTAMSLPENLDLDSDDEFLEKDEAATACVAEPGKSAGDGGASVGLRLDKDSMDRCLEDAKWKTSGVSRLAFPWEKGPMNAIFGVEKLVAEPLKPIEAVWPIDAEAARGSGAKPAAAQPVGYALDNPVFESVLKFNRRCFGPTARHEADLGLRRWDSLLMTGKETWMASKAFSSAGSQAERLDILQAVLEGKSSTTIAKRARSITSFWSWGKEHVNMQDPFPLGQDAVIAYLRCLKLAGRNSAIREFIESLNFAVHVLGVRSEPGLLAHPIVRGIQRFALVNRNEVKQSRPLTVIEVMALESALIGNQCNKLDRFAIGVFLFQLYSRARVSDIRNVSHTEADISDGYGYIEVRTQDHKSKRLSGCIGLALHLVAPIYGLCNGSWELHSLKLQWTLELTLKRATRAHCCQR